MDNINGDPVKKIDVILVAMAQSMALAGGFRHQPSKEDAVGPWTHLVDTLDSAGYRVIIARHDEAINETPDRVKERERSLLNAIDQLEDKLAIAENLLPRMMAASESYRAICAATRLGELKELRADIEDAIKFCSTPVVYP